MRKVVPLTQIYAGHKTNTVVLATNHKIAVKSLPAMTVYPYSIAYDSERGILYVLRPDGTMLNESGFETKTTIGVGLTGFSGNVGADGINGIDGTVGETGIQGLRGEPGPSGYAGLQGAVGEKGEKGSRGLYGQRGKQGPVGRQGRDGHLGLQGEVGYNGSDQELFVLFSETEPEHPMRPGNIWYKMIVRNFSAKDKSACGGSLARKVKYIPPVQTAKSQSDILAYEPSWKLITFSIKGMPEFDSTGLKVDYNKDGTLRNTIRNTLISLLTQACPEAATGIVKIANFDGTDSSIEYATINTTHKWKDEFSNSVTLWHDCDPVLAIINIDTNTMTYTSNSVFAKVDSPIEFEPKYNNDMPVIKQVLNNSIIHVVYYDRAGNCPGIRISEL